MSIGVALLLGAWGGTAVGYFLAALCFVSSECDRPSHPKQRIPSMPDIIVATYENAVNGRVYVWASGTETWQDKDGVWRHRHILEPKDIIHAQLTAPHSGE